MTLSAAIIAGAVAANSVQAAPAGLAATATAAANGASISATITTLVKGTMKTMTWLKIKFATGAGDQLTPQEIARQAQDAYTALASYSDDGTTLAEGGGHSSSSIFSTRLQRPNLYRIDWTHTSDSATSKGVIWSDGSGNFFVMEKAGQEENAQPQKMSNMQMALASAAGVSGSATSIPATFYTQNFGEVLGVPTSGQLPLKKERDENVGDAACYVISYQLNAAKMLTGEAMGYATKAGKLGVTTTTLWIGKQDHFIHKIQTITEGMSLNLPAMSDDKLKAMLESQNKPATPEAIAALRTQMATMMKQIQEAKIILTQTHNNIVVNRKFSPADFAR